MTVRPRGDSCAVCGGREKQAKNRATPLHLIHAGPRTGPIWHSLADVAGGRPSRARLPPPSPAFVPAARNPPHVLPACAALRAPGPAAAGSFAAGADGRKQTSGPPVCAVARRGRRLVWAPGCDSAARSFATFVRSLGLRKSVPTWFRPGSSTPRMLPGRQFVAVDFRANPVLIIALPYSGRNVCMHRLLLSAGCMRRCTLAPLVSEHLHITGSENNSTRFGNNKNLSSITDDRRQHTVDCILDICRCL
jgi:hypothetical protein